MIGTIECIASKPATRSSGIHVKLTMIVKFVRNRSVPYISFIIIPALKSAGCRQYLLTKRFFSCIYLLQTSEDWKFKFFERLSTHLLGRSDISQVAEIQFVSNQESYSLNYEQDS